MRSFKTYLIAILLCIVNIGAYGFSPVYADTSNKNGEELSITLLHPYIERAIVDFYGYNRRYEIGDSYLEILQRDGNIFKVKVTVDTFEGAHNDYYTEIITFTVTPSDITLESYKHSEFIAH